ncbi:PREDICTED: multiple coagulation factor deficiency protein 2 homolog [Dufourea novaeangliae]|uniref:Multiple coagulation factor deficiency protein 2 like protein n=1 Tax=Dufourea novaeangliae TaxID=178035 RepID=A0A154PIB6_DUFNO|nr:PREDICTED: multiple coagulation factor deficiency protein 2 homolog [Dufourea novaeangliae]KZC11547.1 Multiple coagulation factor deficiency protein 2 like protein [Dufourea novaeangliae]
MITTILMSLCVGVSNGFRGPHHPRSAVSHHHYTPQKNVKITQDTNLLQDANHLKEDMGDVGEQLDFSNMTEQEIEFHYFKVHDVDSNAKLDGLEILHAIQHTFHENRLADTEHKTLNDKTRQTNYEDDLPWMVELIDKVFTEDDLDNDGYLGYIEYVLGRQRDHVAQAKRDDNLRIGE